MRLHQCDQALMLTATSTSAPNVGRTLYTITVDGPPAAGSEINALWADASGDTVIVDWWVGSSITPVWHVGVVSHGRFRPLPTPPGVDKPMSVNYGNPPVDDWTLPDVTW